MKPTVTLFVCLLILSCSFAQTKHQKQLERNVSSQHGKVLVNTLNELSWEYRHTNTQKALHFGKRAVQLSQKIPYAKGLAYAYKNLGTVYSIRGEYPKASGYLKESLQQFSELNNRSEVGNIYNLYGLMYWETGKYDSALVNYDAALRYYRQVNDQEGIAIVYSNSGIIYYETGKLDKALSRYAQALNIAEKRNDRSSLANIHTNIGLVYKELRDYKKALYHLKASMELEKEQENRSGVAKSFTNIGVTFYEMNKPDSSLVYHEKALKIYKEIGEKKGISQSLVNIGALYHDRGDVQQANTRYLLALPMKREMSDPLGETIVLAHLGHLRMDEGRNNEAIAYLDTAYRQARHIGSLEYQVETSKFLAELHEQMGHTTEAMLYYKIYTAANARLLSEQSSNELTKVLIDLATKGKQQQIETLETKVITSDSQKVLTALTGCITVAVTGLVVLWLRRRHRKEQLRLKAQLAVNRRALMDYTRQMIAKNAEVQALQEQLETIAEQEAITVSDTVTLSPERVETLNKLSTVRIITDDDWETFKQLFTQVHPRFMLRMKEMYAGITQAELRLAALITLQLSSKEIAAILGISQESVKKSRQRLRKKMELTAEQDLDESVMKML